MASGDALRQRRRRAHIKGDHSLCLEENCEAARDAAAGVTAPVTPAVTPRQAANPIVSPVGLGTRGRRLWRTVTAEQSPIPIEAVLLEEACRIADRLDRLDDILRGEEHEWMRLRIPNNGDGSTVRVIVSGVLSEARQQAVALKQIVADLRQARPAQTQEPEAKESILDELARRRADRQKTANL